MFEMIDNIFKNLARKPATRNYPLKQRLNFEHSRGRVAGITIATCSFCGLCVRKCPAEAIVVNRVDRSWEIDPFKCVICGACAEACPKRCIMMGEAHSQAAGAKTKLKYVQPPKVAVTDSQAG